MLPNAVEPTARMMMGAVKRHWDRINPVYSAATSGTDVYTFTPTQALVGYGLYERVRLRFQRANNSTSTSLLATGLPAQFVKKWDGSGNLVNPSAGDIQAQDHEFYWDSSFFILTNPNGQVLSDATNGGLTIANNTIKINPNDLLTKATPSSSDSVVIMDGTANTVGKTASIGSVFVPQALAVKAAPTTSDSVIVMDAASSNVGSRTALANLFKQPTSQSFTSGTAATYTRPAGCVRIHVRLKAGGGGGGAANTNAGAGGTASSFNSIVANGGGGGQFSANNSVGGAGGSGGSGSAYFRIPGAPGQTQNNVAGVAGGQGGGAGGGVSPTSAGTGGTAVTNSGGGGSGGFGGGGNGGGGGGGEGEFLELLITSPAASYTYTVGPGGAGGAAGAAAGGVGGDGYVFVEEFYY